MRSAADLAEEGSPASGSRSAEPDPASFRDPAGFVFRRRGRLLRQVNRCFAHAFERLHASGLYAELVERGLLVAHEAVDPAEALDGEAHAVIRPKPVDFISYPYEWSFGQLRDAALLTLEVQEVALARGMRLKDASAYNVQFQDGRPIFIDTLSFEPHEAGDPWPAYRQFCEHFLAPLALMSYRAVDLGLLSRTWLDGVPLPLARSLLPRRTLLRLPLLFHLHLHARAQSRSGSASRFEGRSDRMASRGLAGVLASLRDAVRSLAWEPAGTTWADYDGRDSYAAEDRAAKERLVGGMLDAVRPTRVWDLGANDGRYSRLAAARGARTIAFDQDPAAVEKNYRRVREAGERNLLPLRLDLTNPSPSLGWAHRERSSLIDRGPADTILALALLHHLAIGNNVPFERIADFLASTCRSLVIEYVPPSDPRAEAMLRSRRLSGEAYTESRFRAAFERRFRIEEASPVGDSGRVLFRMTCRGPGRESSAGDAGWEGDRV